MERNARLTASVISKALLGFVIASACLPVISRSTMPLLPLSVGALFVVIPFYYLFYIGVVRNWTTVNIGIVANPIGLSRGPWWIYGTTACVVAIAAAQFYTGRSPEDIIFAVGSVDVSYKRYQDYFADNLFGSSIITRLPGILAIAALKYILLISIYRWFLCKKERDKKGRHILLTVSLLSYLYFSEARGTNFEVFEIGVFIFAAAAVFRPRWFSINRSSLWKAVLLIGIGIVIISLFYSRVTGRAELECYTEEICAWRDPGGSSISERISYIAFLLSGYFSFGMYFLGNAILDAYDGRSWAIFLGGVGFAGNHKDLVCNIIIDCSVNWESDLSLLFAQMGLVPLLFASVIIGRLLRTVIISLIRSEREDVFLLYMILIGTLASMFFGSLLVSSSNIIILVLSVSIRIYVPPKGVR